MNNSFFLYLLVLSPLLFFGQNSFRSNWEPRKPNSFERDYFTKFENQSIIILDLEPASIGLNSLIDINKDKHELDDFTSLELIEDLNTLNDQTPFNIYHNPTLERYIRVFLKNRRDNLSQLMAKAQYYFPLFERYLDQYNLPLELKYLAVVESALQPTANSHAGAKGLWQFMYGTAKQYGLEVNTYVDERFDPIKSTQAACAYLTDLYKMFNDWDLVLAAYNSGQGNVSRAIKKSGGLTNYWQLRSYLPSETRGYVPAFLATYYIFKFADKHQLSPAQAKLSYYEVESIPIERAIDFKSITNHLGISQKMIKALNPQYKKEYIPAVKEKPYLLILPINMADEFILYVDQIYQGNKIEEKEYFIPITLENSYVVKPGDNLENIAQRHHITLEQLKQWYGLQTNFLIEHQRLVVTNKPIITTGSTTRKTSSSQKKFTSAKQQTNSTYQIYTVKEGDTLFKISRSFPQVTISQIRDWNNIWNINYLKPGTQLKIY